MKVELIDYMGNDLRVANAARVSFAKESEWEWNREVIIDPDTGDEFPGIDLPKLSERDTKLIHYLAKHGHWSPFSHCFLSFRIKAPLFVARQLAKHQVGLSWNEVSRRYVDSEPEFYEPERWRQRAENVKQGSSDKAVFDEDYAKALRDHTHRAALFAYTSMIEAGVCPEQARMVLPQSMYTEWYWSGSLYAFSRVCNQRLDNHAQKETQEVAKQIAEHCAKLFPVSWEALLFKKDTNV